MRGHSLCLAPQGLTIQSTGPPATVVAFAGRLARRPVTFTVERQLSKVMTVALGSNSGIGTLNIGASLAADYLVSVGALATVGLC